MTATSLPPVDALAAEDEILRLVATLPAACQSSLHRMDLRNLMEVVLDLGRVPLARIPEPVPLSDQPVTPEDLEHVLALVGEFGADNRAGIERTLHRISAIRNRKGRIVGLTLRVGRAVFGTLDTLRDLVESNHSILMLGPPGVGKTTKLREMARILADEIGRRVMIVDTSNEIAGDSDVPHPAIGQARRMQVARPEDQHAIMIEAVENHTPQVIIVDEIGTAAEALACRTIAERGVKLIGTAHGTTLENIIANPTLADLVGGVQTVTLSDEEARVRGTQKTVNERKMAPTFGIVVEIINRDEILVHRDAAAAVDEILRGRAPGGERRIRRPEGGMSVEQVEAPRTSHQAPAFNPAQARGQTVKIYPYGVNPDAVERVIRDLGMNARTVGRPDQATVVLAQASREGDMRLQRILSGTGLPLMTVKKDTTAQIKRLMQAQFDQVSGMDQSEVDAAMEEARRAIDEVERTGEPVSLHPQPSAVRRLQHRLVTRHRLIGESEGQEPSRRIRIYPSDLDDD